MVGGGGVHVELEYRSSNCRDGFVVRSGYPGTSTAQPL